MPDSGKRYGSRYGKEARTKVSEIEEEQKSSHECPECGSESLRRESPGIWVCEKCGNKVSGGAWKPKTGAEKIMKSALRKAGEEE